MYICVRNNTKTLNVHGHNVCILQILFYNFDMQIHLGIICNGGRSQADFNRQGTGDRLVLKSGSQLITIPMRQSDIGSTMWTEGKCFVSMGRYNLYVGIYQLVYEVKQVRSSFFI